MHTCCMRKNQDGFSVFEIAIGILIIGLLSFIGWQISISAQKKHNQEYFTKLTQTTQTYYKEQAGAMNIVPSNQDLTNTCYQTGQGPFDNGHLTCGIKVQKKIQVQPNSPFINILTANLVNVIKKEGFVVGGITKVDSNGLSFTAGIYNKKAAPCTINMNYSPNSAYADAKTSMEYELNCSSSASSIPSSFGYTPLR